MDEKGCANCRWDCKEIDEEPCVNCEYGDEWEGVTP